VVNLRTVAKNDDIYAPFWGFENSNVQFKFLLTQIHFIGAFM